MKREYTRSGSGFGYTEDYIASKQGKPAMKSCLTVFLLLPLSLKQFLSFL